MRNTRFFFLQLLVLLGGLFTSASLIAAELPDFTVLAEKNSPAVVNISTTQKLKAGEMPGHFNMPDMPDMPDNEMFNEFLRKFFEDRRQQEGQGGDSESKPPSPHGDEGMESNSLGSGFIISADGYVITNHHVVKDADEITVTLSDRREFAAEVIGTDVRTDVALLKIDSQELPVLELGSSADLKVGEWVVAIGSPFSFDHSVTAGIVSAKRRSLPSEQYVPFLQTDVAINPGNSGGPLFNLDGKVVGINSQIYSRTGGFMGVSFAIPIDIAMDVVEQLKTTGKVSRGWLGVYIQEINRELAESFGMEHPRGALVAQVIEDSPAEKAGVKVGDVLLSFEGTNISHSADLPPLVGRNPVGSEAQLLLLRDGEEITLKVVIEALPDDENVQAKGGGSKQNDKTGLGVTLAPLSKEVKEALDITEGVLVKKVKEGAARKAGVRSGDVIISIASKPAKDIAALEELIKTLPKDRSVALLIQRKGGPVFLPLKLPE
jgi:serine protease Do